MPSGSLTATHDPGSRDKPRGPAITPSQWKFKEDRTWQHHLNVLCSVVLGTDLRLILLYVSFPVCPSFMTWQQNTVEEEHRLSGQTPWVQVLTLTYQLCDLERVTLVSLALVFSPVK